MVKLSPKHKKNIIAKLKETSSILVHVSYNKLKMAARSGIKTKANVVAELLHPVLSHSTQVLASMVPLAQGPHPPFAWT